MLCVHVCVCVCVCVCNEWAWLVCVCVCVCKGVRAMPHCKQRCGARRVCIRVSLPHTTRNGRSMDGQKKVSQVSLARQGVTRKHPHLRGSCVPSSELHPPDVPGPPLTQQTTPPAHAPTSHVPTSRTTPAHHTRSTCEAVPALLVSPSAQAWRSSVCVCVCVSWPLPTT